MHSYRDLIKYFGVSLVDLEFQNFIKSEFNDWTKFDPAEHNYIISEQAGLELGFSNDDAEHDEDEGSVFDEGLPVFSILNVYPNSILVELPFDLNFTDSRKDVHRKAGVPTQTNQGEASVYMSEFLIDHYKVGDIVISIDYNIETEIVSSLQIRDNNLNEELKL